MAPSTKTAGPRRRIRLVGWISLAIGLLIPRPSPASDAGVGYVLGSCSRVVHGCGGCEEPESGAVSGTFTLSREPIRADGTHAETFVVSEMTLRSESVEVAGAGVLIVDGSRASFLGSLVLDGRERLVGGSGSVVGGYPHAIHIDHLLVDGLRFEIYATPAIYSDDDGDMVADPDDLCGQTPCGVSVNMGGCAIEQMCPCTTRADGELWDSHRDYVRCVIAESRSLLVGGRLDSRARTGLIREAARSICGRSALAGLGAVLGAW
jgi:hypothetical protein